MTKITVQATIHAPLKKVWDLYTEPEHITKWNNASEDWHTPWAKNDLRTGGKFVSRMEAKDGSAGFEFGGTYDEVKHHELISYTMDDERQAKVTFQHHGSETTVQVTFDAESMNSIEMQRSGWQAILDNFKKYVESSR